MSRLQGKVAVITGGTAGIGLATAKRFVDEGAYVFITGRRQKELEAAIKTIGRNIAGVQGDVSKLQDLDRLYEAVKATTSSWRPSCARRMAFATSNVYGLLHRMEHYPYLEELTSAPRENALRSSDGARTSICRSTVPDRGHHQSTIVHQPQT